MSLCLCASAAAPGMAATETTDTLRTHAIDEVVVLSNYKQQAILENPQLEPVSLQISTSKVDKIKMEKQGATTLVDALKYTPGAWIESRGRKVKQMFSVRGQSYPYPTYTINGIWQKEFQEMAYFFNSANIEEISVNRSSSALLTSLSALTGVVNVKTAKPTSRQVHVFGKYGELNTYQTGASYADATEKVSYMAGINGNGTSGVKHMNGQESMWNAMGSFDWRISDKLTWGMNVFYVYGKRELTLPIEPADPKFSKSREEYDPYKALLVATNLKYRASDQFTTELQMNYADRQPMYQSTDVKSDKVNEYEEIDREFTTNWINALALNENNTFRFGLLYNYWKAPKGKRFYYGKKAEVHTISGVITDQHSFGRLAVDAGFRLTGQYYDSWGGFNIEGGGKPFQKVTPITHEWQSPEWQATAGLTYALTDRSALTFNYAGGVVTPRKGALTSEGKEPENEVRMNFDLGYNVLFGAGNKLSFAAFLVNRSNAIAYNGKTIETDKGDIMELYKNTDRRNFGIEAAYQSPAFFRVLSFFTNATVMLGQEKVGDKWLKDQEVPTFIANAGINFEKNGFDANAYFNYVGPYENDRFVSKDYLKEHGKAPLGDFATLDLTAGYRFKKYNLRLFVEAKNLTDNKYQSCAGYPDAGRIISGGFDIKF